MGAYVSASMTACSWSAVRQSIGSLRARPRSITKAAVVVVRAADRAELVHDPPGVTVGDADSDDLRHGSNVTNERDRRKIVRNGSFAGVHECPSRVPRNVQPETIVAGRHSMLIAVVRPLTTMPFGSNVVRHRTRRCSGRSGASIPGLIPGREAAALVVEPETASGDHHFTARPIAVRRHQQSRSQPHVRL